ncbi:hypothetical protein AAH058_10540, partial [Parabacteroides merdae]
NKPHGKFGIAVCFDGNQHVFCCESPRKETKASGIDKEMLKEALRPKFGKSLGRSAVAQRLASSPKSAALRKTSKNNPLNKAKRAAARNKPKGE